MKSLLMSVMMLTSLFWAGVASALQVGDVAYTCHKQTYWVPPVKYYQPCEVIVTQVLGSRYRVERTRDCLSGYAGQSFITEPNKLFWGSDITTGNTGYGKGRVCKPSLFGQRSTAPKKRKPSGNATVTDLSTVRAIQLITNEFVFIDVPLTGYTPPRETFNGVRVLGEYAALGVNCSDGRRDLFVWDWGKSAWYGQKSKYKYSNAAAEKISQFNLPAIFCRDPSP